MIAPDKIYLHGYVFDKTPCDRWDAEPIPKKMFGYKAEYVEYIRKDLVEHIIRVALGPQDALNKIRSL